MVKLEKHARVTGVAREELAVELVARYEAGASLRDLAESLGRSYGFVHRVLSGSGVTFRARGGAMRGKKGT